MGFQNIGHKQFRKDARLKWICGFANAQGGTLYIGINGNNVETHYSYNPLNRRLNNLNDYSSRTGQYLQNINYSYDAVGNILQINDYGLHPRSQSFRYDNLNRLVLSNGNVNCTGNHLGYDASYSYSPAGRILTKNVSSQRWSTAAGGHSVNYRNNYTYQADNPFAIDEVSDAQSGIVNEFGWDANGNMTYAQCGSPVQKRRLCWTEDNRLQGYTEYSDEGEKISAWYNYTADGERNFKIVSEGLNMRQNATDYHFNVLLRDPTLYASALVTLTKHGYTKHYYEGTNRICSKIGGGFSHIGRSRIDDTVPSLEGNYDFQFFNQKECALQTFGCLGFGVELPSIADLYKVMGHEIKRDAPEPAFYYHSDHLGSAAYLTNDSGVVTQALNYLPYGEDWVDDQKQVELQYPRLGIYTFNGKEKDWESGFHYYGARYYWSEMLTGWLSVDPMADKYPNSSPYAYCSWNPIKLVDVDGLYPSAILKYDAQAFPHGGGYRLKSPATHMLSLVSGVKESYIANSIIVERGVGHYVPWYSSKKGGGAITLGYSSNNSNIILTQNYFEDDASAYNNNGYGQNISEWLDILSHEVGLIPQIDKNGGMVGYVSNAALEYVKSLGHDAAPSEKEADLGQTQYRRFNAFVSNKYGEKAISELLSSPKSDKKKINTLDKWWNEYKKSCNESE